MKPKVKINEKYGNLFIVKQVESNKRRNAKFECLCDCGTVCIKLGHLLRTKKTQSCGCLRKKNTKYMRFKGLYEIPGTYFGHIRSGAEKRDLEFNITIEYIWTLFLKQNRKCVLSNILLSFPKNYKDKTGNASLDRIDSSKGYIEGNVQWIHKDINKMKQDLNEQYFIDMCTKIANNKRNSKSEQT
jgi:hypothetical protein